MLNLYRNFPAHKEQPHFECGHGDACPRFYKSCSSLQLHDPSPVNSCPSPIKPPSSYLQIEHAHNCHHSFSHGQWSVKPEFKSILQMVTRPSMVEPRWLRPFIEPEGSCLGLVFGYPSGGWKMSESEITKLIQDSLKCLRKWNIAQWDHHPEHDTPSSTWTHVLFPWEHTIHQSLLIWRVALLLPGALELVSSLGYVPSHARKGWSVSLVLPGKGKFLSICSWPSW